MNMFAYSIINASIQTGASVLVKTCQTKLAFQFAVTDIHYFTYCIACTWPFLGRYTIFVIFLMHNLCIVKQFCCFVSLVYVTDSVTVFSLLYLLQVFICFISSNLK